MFHRKYLWLLLYTAMCLNVGFSQSISNLTGNWVGQTDLLSSPKFLQVRFSGNDRSYTGSMDVYTANAVRMLVTDVLFKDAIISFRVETPRGDLSFKGKMTDQGSIMGTLTGFGKTGKLHLIKAYQHLKLEQFAGVYKNKQSIFYVSYNPLNLLDIIVTENSALQPVLRSFSLIPSGEKQFFTTRSAIAPPEDKDETVSFTTNTTDGAISFLLTQPSGEAIEATKIITEYTETQVKFSNQDIHLGGTLFQAKNAKKAIVILQGAGPTLRTNWIPNLRARYLAEMGITTLIYDKRGTGDSSGSSKQPTFTELAQDAVAAVRYLKERTDLAIEKVGINGMSESAWIVPIACTLSDDINFAIIGSGGAITNEEAHTYEIEQALRTNKFSEADIQEALAFTKLKWDYAVRNEEWGAYKKMVDAVFTKKWFDLAEGPLDNDPKKWDAMRLKPYEDIHAASYIKKMKVPLLLLFGNPAMDDKVPVTKSKDAWNNLLQSIQYKDFTIKSYDNTGHSIFFTLKDKRSVRNEMVYNDLKDWLDKR